MKFKYLVLFAFASVICFSSCKKLRYAPDVSKIQSDVTIIPFYKELHAINTEAKDSRLYEFEGKYGLFFRDFTRKVMGIDVKDPNFELYTTKFLNFDANKEVFSECEKQYGDGSAMKSSFDQAFRYYKYYFPQMPIDKIYLQMSGFSTFMMVDTGYVAVSVERYLGSDCKFYGLLGDPVYLRKKMIREKMVPDAFKALAMVNFPDKDSTDNLLSNMIYQGKVLHFVARMVPAISDTLLFDYSKTQMKWVEKNESSAWSTIVEKKHIFSTDRLLIQKYVGDGPFSAYFGQESPSRMANYLGFRIVEEYLKKNPSVTLAELMMQNDSQLILRKSGYRP